MQWLYTTEVCFLLTQDLGRVLWSVSSSLPHSLSRTQVPSLIWLCHALKFHSPTVGERGKEHGRVLTQKGHTPHPPTSPDVKLSYLCVDATRGQRHVAPSLRQLYNMERDYLFHSNSESYAPRKNLGLHMMNKTETMFSLLDF